MAQSIKYSLTCGVFDCLHQGHINLFKRMREISDRLIVVVHDSKSTFQNKGRFPVQSLEHRMRNIKLSGYVEKVYPARSADPTDALERAIKLFKPAVYIRGDDWQDFPGKDAVKKALIVRYIPYTKGISTTEIVNSIKRK